MVDPEHSPDPEVPTSGPKFSSDYASDGPVPQYDVVEPTEASPDPAVPTSGSEYSCDYSGNGPLQQNSVGSRRKQERNDECNDSTIIVDKILEESMMNISADLTERELLKIFK